MEPPSQDTQENFEILQQIFGDQFPPALYHSILANHPRQNLDVIIGDLSDPDFDPSFYLAIVSSGSDDDSASSLDYHRNHTQDYNQDDTQDYNHGSFGGFGSGSSSRPNPPKYEDMFPGKTGYAPDKKGSAPSSPSTFSPSGSSSRPSRVIRQEQPTPELTKQEKITQLNDYVATLEKSLQMGRVRITDRPNGHPLLYYAIKANNKRIVDMLISQGADVNDRDKNGDPLIFLPFTNDLQDGTDMGRHLFSRGASPHVTARTTGNGLEAVATNPTARYWVREAKKPPEMTEESLNALRKADCLWIKGLPYTVVGQPVAKKMVRRTVTNFRLIQKGKKPLALLFAGPSGHGKSVLSELMSELARMPFVLVPCENYTDEKSMFGAQAPYNNSEKGSLLNNFITDRHEKAGLVLLDEFEKTNYDVWNGFLGVFEKGEYTDRRVRDGKVVDCSKLIFVMTTNVADPAIVNFYNKSDILKAPEGTFPEMEVDREYESLCEVIKKAAQNNIGIPLIGRMNAMVPFIPFNKEEALVVTDTIVRDTQLTFAKPASDKKHLPPVRIDVTEAAVAKISSLYNKDLGARSLRNEVEERVDNEVTQLWLDDNATHFHVCEHEGRVQVRKGPVPKYLVESSGGSSHGRVAEGQSPSTSSGRGGGGYGIVDDNDEEVSDLDMDKDAVQAPDF